MRDTSAPMLSGVGIIVFCFVASALLRLTDNSLAFAQGISDLAQTAGTAAPSESDALLSAIQERQSQLDAQENRSWPSAARR